MKLLKSIKSKFKTLVSGQCAATGYVDISIDKDLPTNMHLCEINTNLSSNLEVRYLVPIEGKPFWKANNCSGLRPTHWRYIEQDVDKRQQEADEWLSSQPTIDEFIDTCEDQELTDYFKRVRKAQLSQE